MTAPRKEFNQKTLESKQSIVSRLSSSAMVQFLMNPLSIVQMYPAQMKRHSKAEISVEEKKTTPVAAQATFPAPLANIIFQYVGGFQNPKFNQGGAIDITQLSAELTDELLVHAQEVLNYVLKGRQREAEALIRKNPRVLLTPGNATDNVNRTIEDVTPVTLTACHTKDFPMLKMMIPYLKSLTDGEATAFEQIEYQRSIAKEAKVYDLSEVATAITTWQNLETAMLKFRQNQKHGIVSNNYYETNVNNLLNAYEILATHSEWNGEQLKEFTMGVIAPFQRLLPTCIAQAYFAGLSYIQNKEILVRRNPTGFKEYSEDYADHYTGGPFYPDNLNFQTGTGIEYAVDQEGRSTRALSATLRTEATALRQYLEFTNLKLERIVRELNKCHSLYLLCNRTPN